MKIHLSHAVISNIGGRKINEDTVGVFHNGVNHCYVLCDGLGGHGQGEIASSLVVSVFENMFKLSDEVVNFAGQAFQAAQEILVTEQVKRNAQKKMKTTCTVLATDERNAYIGHVGDSRVYVFSGNKVKTRTLDHSVPQMLVLAHELNENQIRNHPDRNLLIRVMGTDWDKPQYELMVPMPLRKCQAFLLCSDGFWELIEETEMCSLLKKASNVEEWLASMAEVVVRNGSDREMDNYSAIAVWTK